MAKPSPRAILLRRRCFATFWSVQVDGMATSLFRPRNMLGFLGNRVVKSPGAKGSFMSNIAIKAPAGAAANS